MSQRNGLLSKTLFGQKSIYCMVLHTRYHVYCVTSHSPLYFRIQKVICARARRITKFQFEWMDRLINTFKTVAADGAENGIDGTLKGVHRCSQFVLVG